MIVVHKWSLRFSREQSVDLPKGAAILDVQLQGDQYVLWALCDADNPLEPRKIVMVGTGHTMPAAKAFDHISTVQAEGLVWHWFESF